jgi:hypothetical protein
MRLLLLITINILLLVSVPAVFSQSRDITDAELDKLITDAAAKREGVPRREKVSTTGYDPGESSEALYEFGPNDTYHYRFVEKRNGVETKAEVIRIGSVRYTIQKDGSWLKNSPQQSTGTGSGMGSGYGTGSNVKPEVTEEIRFVGSDEIHGKTISHYRKIHVVKFIGRTPPMTRKVVDEYWFDADGLLVKESHEDVHENFPQNYSSVTEYEYDKDIKITAPIPD